VGWGGEGGCVWWWGGCEGGVVGGGFLPLLHPLSSPCLKPTNLKNQAVIRTPETPRRVQELRSGTTDTVIR